MGFTLGSSSYCPPALLRPNALVPSRSRRPFAVWAHRKAPQEEPGTPAGVGSGSCSRRRAAAVTLILLGASASSSPPLLPLAAALQVNQESGSFGTDEAGTAGSSPVMQANSEQLHETGNPVTSFLAVVNSIGVIASGVLAALYAISRQEKAAAESDIQTMESQLKEKERAITSVKKAFEEKMLYEKQDRQKMIRTLKEGEAALSNQLASANATISGLGNELRGHKRSVSELQQRVDGLQSSLSKADEEKRRLQDKLKDKANDVNFLQDRVGLLGIELKDKEKSIETLQSLLAGKESECERMSSLIDLTRAENENMCSSLEQLKIEAAKTREEIDSSSRMVDELKVRLDSITFERDEAIKKLRGLQDDYDLLKSASLSKEKSNAELLSKKDEEIRQLDEKLAISIDEAQNTQERVTILEREKDAIRAMLEEERSKVVSLQSELQLADESLRAAKLDASTLETSLDESQRRCKELESMIARIQLESSDAEKQLKNSLYEARSTSSTLSNELALVKETLSRAEEELGTTSDQLAVAATDQESLKRELVEVYKKTESTAQDLKEERKKVAALSQELEASVNQIKRDTETVTALKDGLNEATKSLDDMNQRASTLSKELESAGARIKNLEEEKLVLYNTLAEQNKLTLEAQENIEDAQDLIMRLGGERENLELRAKNLEDDLAAAKGEILRMRRERTVASVPSNTNQNMDGKETATSVVKKNGNRRKRTEPPSEESQ